MKKLLFTAMIALFMTASGFATPITTVNRRVSNNFKSDFPKAENVTWVTNNDYSRATFQMNDVSTEAFYDLNGEFIGSSHAVSVETLPLNAKRSLAKKYAAYTVKEAIEFNGVNETAYYIMVAKDNNTVILKVLNGNVDVFKK